MHGTVYNRIRKYANYRFFISNKLEVGTTGVANLFRDNYDISDKNRYISTTFLDHSKYYKDNKSIDFD